MDSVATRKLCLYVLKTFVMPEKWIAPQVKRGSR